MKSTFIIITLSIFLFTSCKEDKPEEIIDDNGNLIDYNTKYANQVDENDNNPTAIIDINKQWIANQ